MRRANIARYISLLALLFLTSLCTLPLGDVPARIFPALAPGATPLREEALLERVTREEEYLAGEESAAADDGEYIVPDWSAANPPKGPRIAVDVHFHHFADRYGFLNLTIPLAQRLAILADVAQTWARAGIWVRFKKSEAAEPEVVTGNRADAYRWWVAGARPGSGLYGADYKRYLKAYMNESEAQKVVAKASQYDGHALMNWVLGIGANAQTTTSRIDIYAIPYWYWYNGGAGRGRIFVRAGSCHGPRPRSAEADMIICNGWSTEHQKGEVTEQEVARVMVCVVMHARTCRPPCFLA
jgi:hypothetical protein